MKFGSARGVYLWDILPRIAQGKSDAVFVSDMVTFGKIVLIGSKVNILNGFLGKVIQQLMSLWSVQTKIPTWSRLPKGRGPVQILLILLNVHKYLL
jgi:hypothetical protein